MSEIIRDYKNYDYFSVSLKTDAEREMVKSYLAFGWTAVERSADKRFSDYVTYTFRRPHIFENKDRLQFLQVKMEKSSNLCARLKKDKHKFCAVLGTIFLLISLIFTVGGTLLAVLIASANAIWSGAIAGATGVVGIALSILWIVKRTQKENIYYAIMSETSEIEAKSAVLEAARLTGVIE